jgi:hypothetical protein
MENINFNQELDETLEIFKLTKEDAHLYKNVPMATSEGYLTPDFLEEDLIFRGKLKISIKGEFALIYFINNNNTIAYVCLINEDIDKCVHRYKNSTRYFVLKVMNDKGIPMYVGLGISIINF